MQTYEYPDGHCYSNSWRYASSHEIPGRTFVVHGRVTNIECKRFGHAWVEIDDDVIDPTTGVKMKKDLFYRLLDAVVDAIYTPEQAMINTIRIGNSGPWTADEVQHRIVTA